MATGGRYGVTLCELHGEDVELHESNTRAIWIDRELPDHRRVVVTNRPVRHDEMVYIKLSGTGAVRIGITNCSPYNKGEIEDFCGTILFADSVYDNHVKRQIQLCIVNNKRFVVYQNEYETNSNLRKIEEISEEIGNDIFMFCEIRFGDIRVCFESKEGNSLTSTVMKGEQIGFIEKDAVLTKTTGGVIIPEIELKLGKPVYIKPKVNRNSETFIMRYGLTNVSPGDSTEEIIKLYSIANAVNEVKEARLPPADTLLWFQNADVRTDAFNGYFTLCITEKLEVETDVNFECEMENLVPVGPDLEKPLWLVLEVYNAEVTVECQHEVVKEQKQDEDEIRESRFIVASWKEKDITDDAIKTFVRLKSGDDSALMHGSNKNRVLMIFKQEKVVKFLQNKLSDESFWELTSLTGIQETSSVLVCGLPNTESKQTIGLFFKNTDQVKMSLTILKCEYQPEKGETVLVLSSPEEAETLCKKKLKFKGRVLKLCSYYDILYESDDIQQIYEEEKTESLTFNVSFENVKEIQYIREYQSLAMETELSNVCSQIKWRTKQSGKVRFDRKCSCDMTETCARNWQEQTVRVFKDFISRIVIHKRKFSQSVWEQITEITDAMTTKAIRVFKDDATHEIEIIGVRDDETLNDLISTIDLVKPPVSEPVDIPDLETLQVLKHFGILSKIETEECVVIQPEESKYHITGPKENVSNAKVRLLSEINLIKNKKHCHQLRNEFYEILFKTPMVKQKIEVELKQIGVNNGIEWKADATQLLVWCEKPELLQTIVTKILSVISYKSFKIMGDASVHSDLLNAKMSELQRTYKLYAGISYSVNDSDVAVEITCMTGYMDILTQTVTEAVEQCLTKQMKIMIPEYIAKYINEHLLNELKLNLKREELCDNNIEFKDNSFYVTGTPEAYKNVSLVVISLAKHVQMEWVSHTVRGIDLYFGETEGIDLLKSLRSQCVVEKMTENEMKDHDVHAVTALDSGAIIFAIAGDITDPVRAIDIIVNPTDSKLKHSRGLSRAIARRGGLDMAKDVSTFQEKQGVLKTGEVYISSAGKLPFQKVFHVSIPSDGVDQSNVGWAITDTLKNVFRIMDNIEDSIFRSIALPLLGDLRKFSLKILAKVIIETLKDLLEQHKNIRQVFIYDRNPEVCRVLHSEMQRVFKDSCFCPPVQNVNINKAMTIKTLGLQSLRRKGVRTIPLPGDKRLLLKWGELKAQQSDVLVNITTTFPTLNGVISKSLVAGARSPGFDLDKEYENEIKKGNYSEGDIVQTTAGRLPCNAVYHLKIDTRWQGQEGQKMLANYIETCLRFAIKTEVKSIAFPTIGTVDCNYPKNEVAKTFLRTVGEFMTKRLSCKLEEISILIYQDDHETTLHFENEISLMYSERPHRLEAIIEETQVIERRVLDDEDKNKPPPVLEGPKAPPSPPQQPKPALKPETSTYKVTDAVTLSLTVGNIENIAADVLVCTTAARNFPNIFGAISSALKKAGGSKIQDEITKKYPHGIPKNEIAYSGAGKLQCKQIFYIPLQDYKSTADVKKIKDFVKRCLAQAEKFGHSSICFPSIGTGNFKYSDNDSSKAVFDAIQEHYAVPQKNLKKVVIALFAGATNTVQVFRQSASARFQQISLSKDPSAGNRNPSTGSKAPVPGGKALSAGGEGDVISQSAGSRDSQGDNSFVLTIPNTQTTVEIFEGKLEFTRADVILNTTTSFPNLNGAIPAALCRQGGQCIQGECNQYVGTATNGDIIETGAGNLSCSSIFHYVLPTWDSVGGIQIIQNCMQNCLDRMKKKGYHTIALPAIGTGGYKYQSAQVAEGIHNAVVSHANDDPISSINVKIVLFGPAKNVNQEILSFFQHLPKIAGDKLKPKAKRVKFEDNTTENAGVSSGSNDTRTTTDFVLIKLVSRDREKINKVKQKIEERIKIDSADLYIDIPKHGEVMLHDKKNMKILEELGTANHVDIQVDHTQNRIFFKGISPKKTGCREKVRGLLAEMSDKHGNLIYRKHLLQSVEWCYLENNGKIVVPYPKSVAVNIQTEDYRGADQVKFKDTDGCDYVVDLRKMEEYRLENGQRKSVIGVLKKDLSSGELGNFPNNWNPMEEKEDVAVISLDNTTQEYMDVFNNFKSTIGSFRLNQVIEIKRIQNKSLYLLYKAEKEKLHRINNRTNNEKTLWHGTSADKEKYIISDGFNRSYAGKTFGGNVWYGKGVYFAVHSEYSALDAYSPLDPNGVKRIFQVKVLTGEYTEVRKGFADRVPLFKPGSNTERYDSTCDDALNPKEFVIYRDTSAYPEYVILFK